MTASATCRLPSPWRGRTSVMPSAVSFLDQCRDAVARATSPRINFPIALMAAIHLAALGLMLWSELDIVAKAAFVLFWGLLNFLWLAVLRRPAVSAGLAIAGIVLIILLSRLKHDIVLMTASFIDLMMIDTETFAFLMTVFPGLGPTVGGIVALAGAALVLLWRVDPLRARLRTA